MEFNIGQSVLVPALKEKEMLFAGFGDDPEVYILDFPFDSEQLTLNFEDDPDMARNWLHGHVDLDDGFHAPYAVVCALNWLKSTNYALPRLMKANPYLQYIPVIALSTEGVAPEKSLLARHGVDDCYTVPVQWEMLQERLDFLNEFKPKLLKDPVPTRLVTEARYKISPLKRLFDILGALAGIVLSLPVWLPIAIAIRLESRGAVIYKSKRVGAGYHVFDFYKFRSMFEDAETRLDEYRHMNQYHEEGPDGPVFVKISRDPRITRVGRFIRKYSLDELPQFINVLLGDMSLVGNRPLPLYEAEMLMRDEYCERFLAPAGLTGLWQVTKRGRADMSMEERIALDIAYSRTYSFWTDLIIILRTFGAMRQNEDV